MKKKLLLIIPFILILAIVLLIIFRNKIFHGQEKISLRLGWVSTASFCGEIVGAKMFAEKYNLDLTCVPGGMGINPTLMVQSGENTFGTLAADEVISAIDNGADLVIIGVINYYSPGGFVSLKENNIVKPQDLIGKSVGILPFGSTNLLYEIMLKKNKIDRSKISEIPVSYDLKPFISGSYDVQPVFVYDETVTLDLKNIEYNLIEPKNYGVSIKGPVYFCKRETLEKNPELVKAFVYAMADGWNYAINHKNESIKMLKEFAPEIDVNRESMVLEKAVPYYSGYNNQPINSDYQSWEDMINQLYELRVIKEKYDVKKIVYLDFVHEYYEEKQQ